MKNWKPAWKVEKWYRSANLTRGLPPDEVVEFEGNVLANAGITAMLNLLIGAGGSAFSVASGGSLGVGNSSTAAAATQTDLQGGSKERVAFAAPSQATQVVTFVSTFGSSNGNFAWEEFGIFNAASGGTMLSRKVSALGTKASGATWVLTVTLTIS